MKFKITKKAINEGYSKIIKVGYCKLQSLLRCKTPIAYISGAEGWRADIYEINGIAIVTGYQTFGNIEVSRDICQKYEKMADNTMWSDTEEEQLEDLINEFLKEVLA